MSKSFDELEHDVEASRGRLDGTLAELQSRLNPSNLAEELTGHPRSCRCGGAGRLGAFPTKYVLTRFPCF